MLWFARSSNSLESNPLSLAARKCRMALHLPPAPPTPSASYRRAAGRLCSALRVRARGPCSAVGRAASRCSWARPKPHPNVRPRAAATGHTAGHSLGKAAVAKAGCAVAAGGEGVAPSAAVSWLPCGLTRLTGAPAPPALRPSKWPTASHTRKTGAGAPAGRSLRRKVGERQRLEQQATSAYWIRPASLGVVPSGGSLRGASRNAVE
jgi:hypothetical protein